MGMAIGMGWPSAIMARRTRALDDDEIVKGGVTWLRLESREEYQPIPVLMVPKLNGSLVFYPNGTTLVDVEAAMDQWVIVPEYLEWRDVYINIDVAPFNVSDVSSVPEMVVSMRGGLLVGGDGGFYATIEGTIDTGAGSAMIAVQHAGQAHAHHPVRGVNGECPGAANPLTPLHCPCSASSQSPRGPFHAHDMDALWSVSVSYLSVSTPDLMPPMGAPQEIADPA